ncbi:hypothetical protein TKWG_15020 [Advenella kashmirensis WT001]|uniref:Uncharacterized protein n=1 Tax=Advenella kashmirensis (strain DSM 17095 / LMG 22695 / WT001) TaxID=1036672 RepID=I3UDE5_ADVKW|nr:hypothetical protein TKWG_15020 [Advenella kashmirensis WT001]
MVGYGDWRPVKSETASVLVSCAGKGLHEPATQRWSPGPIAPIAPIAIDIAGYHDYYRIKSGQRFLSWPAFAPMPDCTNRWFRERRANHAMHKINVKSWRQKWQM